MQKFIRLIALMLAVLMLLPAIVACDKNKDKNNDKNNDKDNANTNTEFVTKLPDKDWDGAEFRVLGREGSVYTTNFEIAVDEFPDDTVGQAVYNRNESLKEKYNFNVTYKLDPYVHDAAKTFYEATDDQYDLVIYQPKYVQSHAQSGYLLNLLDSEELPYLDVTNGSWNQYANNQLTIAGKLFYTTNDFLLQDKQRTQFMFYNRELARDLQIGLYPDSETPFEDMVDNNEWTLENLGTIVKDAYADNDGLAGAGEMDQYGLCFENHGCFAGPAFAAGFRLSTVDAKGNIRLSGATDKMLNILDRVLEITGDKSLTYVMDDFYTQPTSTTCHEHLFNHFTEGRMLIIVEYTSLYDEYLYRADVEVGALPLPKYDADQEDYWSFPNITNGSLLAVPYTVTDTDKASFCLEALTEYSTNTTLKTYIDTKCKYQEAYDEDCARMLDICFENVVWDVAAMCDFGGLWTYVYADLQKSRKNGYSRMYQMNAKSANKAISELVEAYSKMQ